MPKISLNIDEDLLTQVTNRGATSEAIRESLSRYYYMLARARQQMVKCETFTAAELSLMVDSCNGTLFQEWSVPLLAANIEDSISLDGLNEKWEVDGPVLLAKINALDFASIYALVDSIEEFWEANSRGENPVIADILKP